MASPTLDHVSDVNGAELHRLSKLYTFPDFVKSAEYEVNWKPTQLAATAYGDPRTRQFPCHSSASTWLSHLYFNEKQAELAPKNAARIKERLDGFARYWGVTDSVHQIKVAYDEMHKDADSKLPDSSFAYVWTGDNGHKTRHMRMVNAMEVKTAAEWLQKHRDRILFSDRHTIAGKIMQKAAEFGASLGDAEQFVHRQAGRGICNPAEVEDMLRGRARLAKTAEMRDGLLKMAETVKTKPAAALGPQMLVKIATTVDMFDRSVELLTKYSEIIPRADDVVFRLTIKEAKDGRADACAMTSGTIYDRTQFKQIKLADVQALFGDDFADEVSLGLSVDPVKMAELASTLPRGDAEDFDRFMNESGIEPIQTKAASMPTSIDPALLGQAGSQY